jgi:hypothetical protein
MGIGFKLNKFIVVRLSLVLHKALR